MDEDTVTIGGPAHHARVYRDQYTKGGGACWVCTSFDERDDTTGYGDTSGDAMRMYLIAREERHGIPRDALTTFYLSAKDRDPQPARFSEGA